MFKVFKIVLNGCIKVFNGFKQFQAIETPSVRRSELSIYSAFPVDIDSAMSYAKFIQSVREETIGKHGNYTTYKQITRVYSHIPFKGIIQSL